MKYLEYREKRIQGTFEFPVAYYHIDNNHPRYHMTYHWHPEYEIIRILEGSFHMTIDNQIFVFHAGDVIFVQDGSLHGGIPTDCIYECFVFDLNTFLKENHICKKELEIGRAHV